MANRLGTLIKEYREKTGLSLRDLGKITGLSYSYIAQLEKGVDPRTGKNIVPTINTLQRLAKGLNMGLEELMLAAGYLPNENEDLSSYLRRVPAPELQTALNKLDQNKLEERYTASDVIPAGPMVRVPVLGVIRAGEPLYAVQNLEGYILTPAEDVKNGEYFFLRVKGDSMVGARIQEGDLVLVRKQDYVDDGEIAVVLVGGEEATLKRVFRANGKWLLQPENPSMKPVLIDEQDMKIIGKVVRVQFEPV